MLSSTKRTSGVIEGLDLHLLLPELDEAHLPRRERQMGHRFPSIRQENSDAICHLSAVPSVVQARSCMPWEPVSNATGSGLRAGPSNLSPALQVTRISTHGRDLCSKINSEPTIYPAHLSIQSSPTSS
ncbi:hypothetical protein H920_18108 [Fukomys damarensis]|uniref:Uncharacterized protein n=1 Tax=Fukomys damarensis TaxID=885580 RepID=A0A091CSQ9_FUKDA|nr:hypothetical protein H920_18108 [Fukomys damarensis]